jgi:hypothetical protein
MKIKGNRQKYLMSSTQSRYVFVLYLLSDQVIQHQVDLPPADE